MWEPGRCEQVYPEGRYLESLPREDDTYNGLSIRDADEKLQEEERKVLPKGGEPKTKRRWNLRRRLLPEPPVCC